MMGLLHRLIIVLAFLAFIGCDSETSSSTASGVSLSGNISGRVRLVDTTYHYSHGYLSLNDRSGVVVRIEGTAFEAITDSNGVWTIRDIPTGTYIASFDKSGFGRKKTYSIQHVGNGHLYLGEITLKKLPRANVGIVLRGFEGLVQWKKDSTWIDTSGNEQFTRLYDTIPNGVAIFSVTNYSGLKGFAHGAMFLSRSDKIDPFDSSSYDLVTTSGMANDVGIYKQQLHDAGFKKGDRIFVRAGLMLTDEVYIDGQRFNYYGYYDYSKRRYTYTGFGLNPSEVKSFILP